MVKMKTPVKSLILFVSFVFANVKGGELMTCARNYVKVGCYDEYNPGNKDLIVFDRYGIKWGNIEAYMHNLACKCEEKVRAINKGRSQQEKYVGFALHFWGECYGRTLSRVNALAVKRNSKRCTGDNTFTMCFDKNPECTGHAFSEYVFRIKPGQDEVQSFRHCRNGSFEISCSAGMRMYLQKVLYGERTASACGKPISVGWKAECGNVKTESFSIYYSHCLRKTTCVIPSWRNDPNDPCPGVEKFIEVQYKCELNP